MLSIDIGTDGFRGPENLFSDPELWPGRVIAMNLARVGTGEGPDLDLLNNIDVAGPAPNLCGGGVRNVADLDAIQVWARKARCSPPRFIRKHHPK